MLDINIKKQTVNIEEGQYVGTPVMIIDLGKQFQTDWQTGDIQTWDDGNPKIQNEVFISFALLTEEMVMEDGTTANPRVGKTFTVSTNEKAAIVGLLRASGVKSTNLLELVNTAVNIDVGKTATGNPKVRNFAKPNAKVVYKDNIVSVAELIKNASIKVTVFDIDNPDEDVLNSLPDFLKNKINDQASREKYREKMNPAKASTAKPVMTEEEVEDVLDKAIPYWYDVRR